jgi:hypothetical protein
MDLEKVAEKLKAQLKTEKKAESKDAAPVPSAEIKKTEESKEVKVVTPETKEIKPEVKAEEKSNVQKRFDELTAKIKTLEDSKAKTQAERDAEKAEKESMKSELDGIKKQLSMTPKDKIKEVVKTKLSEARKKYLDEDKTLPREDRREMTQEELDEWRAEDFDSANDWATRRTIRRTREEEHIHKDEEMTVKANEILDKQTESQRRVFVKHPELNHMARKAELEKQGKSREEVFKILCEENPKFKVAYEILQENKEKYILSENGPELIAEEMENRMKSKDSDASSELDEIKAKLSALEAENAKLKGLDTEVTSTREAPHKEPITEIEQKRVELAKKLGISADRIKARVAERVSKGYDG